MTVYSRHPFAFSQCGAVDVDAIWRKKAPRYQGPVTVFSVDHILTTTSQDFYRQTDKNKGNKILVFDAGSSVFASSGSWLTCAYAQSGMFPDGVFSWERDYIDPNHYLEQIPPQMRPKVHFANVPVIAGVETGMISPRVKVDGKVYVQPDSIHSSICTSFPIMSCPPIFTSNFSLENFLFHPPPFLSTESRH